MVVRDTAWPAGTPCWVDLAVDDFGRAQAFYSALFGWTVDAGPAEFGGYATAELQGHSVAGIGPKQDPSQPTVWTTYLAVEDADATVAKVTEAGGALFAPVMDVMGVGRLAVLADPTGAIFGIWEAGTHTGADIANVAGAVVWNEQLSRDFEASKSFYATAFGYDYDDMSAEGFQYATFKVGDAVAGGLGTIDQGSPAEVPAHWSAYFGVADTDSTVDKVQQLGGQVLVKPQDTPHGRMAVVTDDQGAVFTVISMDDSA